MSAAKFASVPDDFRCLAIETSSAISSVAACGSGLVTSGEYGSPGEQSRQVYSCVRDVMRDAGVGLGDLDCIAFGCGPGGFTGLRVGAAVAQSLAYGAGLPVCRISSLAVLAAAAMRARDVTCVAACVDARMGEAYLGVYSRDGTTLRADVPDRLVSPDEFVLDANCRAFAAGGGWSAYPQLYAANEDRLIETDTALVPGAVALLGLAAQEFGAGRAVAPHEAVPNYVRDKVTS